MQWVVVANTNNCCIYYYDQHHSQLTLFKEIKHPEFKLKTSDTLTTARPGHYHKGESARGAYSPHMDAKEIEIDKFSREIAEELDVGRKASSYEELILIIPPHMNGLLFKHLSEHVKKLVINTILKDVPHLSEHELINYLKNK